MQDFKSFALFGLLPPELQLMIWEYALAQRAVWAVFQDHTSDKSIAAVCMSPVTSRNALTMGYIGAHPFTVGHACETARRVMQRVCISPARDQWVNMDTTVIHLGSDLYALSILETFEAAHRLRFRHVAITWHAWSLLVKIGNQLATLCPDLETITVERNLFFREELSLEAMTPETAARIAELPASRDVRNAAPCKHEGSSSSLVVHFTSPKPTVFILPENFRQDTARFARTDPSYRSR